MVEVQTQCGHCGEPINLRIDSELNIRVLNDGADPVLFAPEVDFATLEDPSIIDAF